MEKQRHVLYTMLYSIFSSVLELPFYENKNYSADHGTHGNCAFSDGIPSVSRNGTRPKFRFEPFRGREKAWNSVPNHSAKDKKLGISFQTVQRKYNTRNFVPNNSWNARNSGEPATAVMPTTAGTPITAETPTTAGQNANSGRIAFATREGMPESAGTPATA